MRLTTRMAHSRAMVEPREARPENSLAYPARTRQWVLMPGNSRVRYEALLADYARFEEEAAASPFNRYADAEDKSLGIIACGIAYNYLAENYPDGCPHPVLKISQYPLPQELVRRMASECKALLIIEEGQPVVEEALRGILPAPVEIRGRMSGELPRTGGTDSGQRTHGPGARPARDPRRQRHRRPPSARIVPGLRPPRHVYGTDRGRRRI